MYLSTYVNGCVNIFPALCLSVRLRLVAARDMHTHPSTNEPHVGTLLTVPLEKSIYLGRNERRRQAHVNRCACLLFSRSESLKATTAVRVFVERPPRASYPALSRDSTISTACLFFQRLVYTSELPPRIGGGQRMVRRPRPWQPRN